jgi:hypothetical protein
MHAWTVLATVGLAAVLWPLPAVADPVAVASGRLSFDTGDPPSFAITTVDGLSFHGVITSGYSIGVFDCHACPAGTSVRFGSRFGGAANEAFAFTMSDDGSGFTSYAGSFDFSAPAVTLNLPAGPFGDPFFWFLAPFTFTGHIAAYDGLDLSGPPIFERALIGSGTAHLLMYYDVQQGLFHFDDMAYDFARVDPIPEPATLILVGTAALAAARWRTRRRAPPGR